MKSFRRVKTNLGELVSAIWEETEALFNPDSAVEGETKGKAQAFRSERNWPVPLSQVQQRVR